jgi:hypothetical protein
MNSGRFGAQGGARRGSKTGARITAGLLFVVIAVGVGAGVVFWTDEKALIRHVKERDHLAVAACWVMSKRGAPADAREPLYAAIEQGHPTLRAAACLALGSRKKNEDVAHLGKLSNEAKGMIGDGYARHWLRQSIDDPDLTVQAAACGAVGPCQLEELCPFLIEKLASQDVKLRHAAKRSLDAFLAPGEQSYDMDRDRWLRWWQDRRR